MADGISIAAIDVEPLSIPLREPFVIATGRIDTTRAALVRATLENRRGARATGLGEAAALPRSRARTSPSCWRRSPRRRPRSAAPRSRAGRHRQSRRGRPAHSRVARAGVEAAILDAWARHAGVPLYAALGGSHPTELVTDITLSISDPERMAASARAHRAAGFTTFKVKVGRDWRADLASLRAVAEAVPDARFGLDANAGFAAHDALALLDAALNDGLHIECFEQPCAATISPAWPKSPPGPRCR
jgi:L-alanine-DL-glutamate epimerase-like enolase superfamily enzyme